MNDPYAKFKNDFDITTVISRIKRIAFKRYRRPKNVLKNNSKRKNLALSMKLVTTHTRIRHSNFIATYIKHSS